MPRERGAGAVIPSGGKPPRLPAAPGRRAADSRRAGRARPRLPGLGDLTGARVLAELGGDRTRFADARAVKAYARSAPVTRASGRSISITYRRIKNDRLAAAGFVWAFIATSNSPAPESTTTDADKHTETAIPQPSGTCSTASSAACTNA